MDLLSSNNASPIPSGLDSIAAAPPPENLFNSVSRIPRRSASNDKPLLDPPSIDVHIVNDYPTAKKPHTFAMVRAAIRSRIDDGYREASVQSIKKFMQSEFQVDVAGRKHLIKQCLLDGVASGDLVRRSGRGAVGLRTRKNRLRRKSTKINASRQIIITFSVLAIKINLLYSNQNGCIQIYFFWRRTSHPRFAHNKNYIRCVYMNIYMRAKAKSVFFGGLTLYRASTSLYSTYTIALAVLRLLVVQLLVSYMLPNRYVPIVFTCDRWGVSYRFITRRRIMDFASIFSGWCFLFIWNCGTFAYFHRRYVPRKIN